MGRPVSIRKKCRPSRSKKVSVQRIKRPGIVKKSTAKSKKKSASKAAATQQPRGQSQSCHQCRQSIHSSKGVSEVKQGKERLKCSKCTRFWCEQCLLNRYGVTKNDTDPTTWSCPVCEKKCNCSLCRKREGKLATGILTPIVKTTGFESVSEFLEKGTDDIARVLQWRSPDSSCLNTKKHSKSGKGSSTPTRRKHTRRVNRENSKSLANGTHSKSTSPTSSDTNVGSSCHGGGMLHSDSGCGFDDTSVSGDQNGITVEDELDVAVDSSLYLHNQTSNDSNQNNNSTSPAKSFSMEQESPQLSLGGNSNELVVDKVEEQSIYDSPRVGNSLRRRSLRQRKQATFFSADDFRRESPEGSPRSLKRFDRQVKTQSKSPKANSFSPKQERESGPMDSFTNEEEEIYRDKQVTNFEQKKTDYEQKLLEEKNRCKEEKMMLQKRAKEKREREKFERALKRNQALEEKAQIKNELQLVKIKAQERMKLAQGVKKQALKELNKRQREKEKIRKQNILLELKEKTREERMKKMELFSAPISCTNDDVCSRSLEDDSPDLCPHSLPSLPPLPFQTDSIPPSLLPNFLFVCEFLCTFSKPLNLKRNVTAIMMNKTMASGKGMCDVYVSLLKTIINEDDPQTKEFKSPKRQRDLEQMAKSFLSSKNINGFRNHLSKPSFEESVTLLDHLCHEVLSTPVITNYIESLKNQTDQIKREQRLKEREVTKRIGDTLKQLCDDGCSLEEMIKTRTKLAQEVTVVRTSFEEELVRSGGSTRKTLLGTDRYNRRYWRLQSVPGVVVESSTNSSPLDCDSPNMPQWSVIDTQPLLDELMDALHPNGCREKPLYSSLLSLKSFLFKPVSK